MVECTVDFKLPPSAANETIKKTESASNLLPLSSFVPGDAYGIYSSNTLADVCTVLTRTVVYDGDNLDLSKTDEANVQFMTPWNYFTTNKNVTKQKQAYIQLSDKVSFFRFAI